MVEQSAECKVRFDAELERCQLEGYFETEDQEMPEDERAENDGEEDDCEVFTELGRVYSENHFNRDRYDNFGLTECKISDDYKAAGVPMMPLVHGRFETKKQILLYSTILGPLGMAPYWLGMLGAVYGATAVLLGVLFIGAAWRVMRNDSEKNCKQLFGFSIFYLL